MTNFTVSGGAKAAWHNKGFQDGLKNSFTPPASVGATLQAAYKTGYWSGRRQSRQLRERTA